MDKGLFDNAFIHEILGYEKIVNPPPCIVLPGIKSIGPPGIFYGFRIKMPEGVHISHLEHPVQNITLNSQKPGPF